MRLPVSPPTCRLTDPCFHCDCRIPADDIIANRIGAYLFGEPPAHPSVAFVCRDCAADCDHYTLFDRITEGLGLPHDINSLDVIFPDQLGQLADDAKRSDAVAKQRHDMLAASLAATAASAEPSPCFACQCRISRRAILANRVGAYLFGEMPSTMHPFVAFICTDCAAGCDTTTLLDYIAAVVDDYEPPDDYEPEIRISVRAQSIITDCYTVVAPTRCRRTCSAAWKFSPVVRMEATNRGILAESRQAGSSV
jgi:hypothetical protein